MTKGRAAISFGFVTRDDEQQVPPLRYAPVGMTKGRAAISFGFVTRDGETADPSATLGMTKGGVALPLSICRED
jgi:hypothetical protein